MLQCGNDAFPHTIQYKFIFPNFLHLIVCLLLFPAGWLYHWHLKSWRLLPHAVFLSGIFLCNAIGHMCSDGAHLRCSLHMKHLVVEVDVWPDLLQHGALRCPRQKQGLVDLQAPGPECLQRADPGAGCAASCHQKGPDGTVQPVAFGVKLFLELPQCLQEALQGTLQERNRWWRGRAGEIMSITLCILCLASLVVITLSCHIPKCMQYRKSSLN